MCLFVFIRTLKISPLWRQVCSVDHNVLDRPRKKNWKGLWESLPSGMYVTLAMEPRFHVKVQCLNNKNDSIAKVTSFLEACIKTTSQVRVFYFRTALQQRPWCPLVT